MQARTLEGLIFHPGFIAVFLAILLTIGNIMVGVSIFPKDKRKKGYKLHRLVYSMVILSYGTFIGVNYYGQGNRLLNYVVLFYFLVIIPLSRRMDVTLHAILASVGLVLLTLVATLNLL